MNERINQIKADLRFWWWKARHVHAQRYISVITILALLGGLTFFSFSNQSKVLAASASWSGNTIQLSGSDASYMLLNNGTTDGTCLWPMNRWSADNFNFNGVASYRGKACTPSPSSLMVIVDPGATLSVVGDIPLSALSVNGGTVTTAPADAKGFAVPYGSRRNYYVERYTGFLELDMSNQTLNSVRRKILVTTLGFDDATMIESGWTTNNVSVDAAPGLLPWERSGYGYNVVECNQLHSSFRSNNDAKGCAGPFTNGNSAPRTFYIAQFDPPKALIYIPIRITTAEAEEDHVVQINYTIQDEDGSGNVLATKVDNAILPLSMIYAPQESGADVGKLSTAQGFARYEYAQEPTGQRDSVISSDLSKMYTWNGSYQDNGTPDYHFYSRVNLADNGTFKDFIQPRGASTTGKFYFKYANNFNGQQAGNPFSNSRKDDGSDYRFGSYQDQTSSGPFYKQNYKLQYHNDTLTTGLAPGIRLTVSGDVGVSGTGLIDTSGKGLPGGRNYSDVGISGIGGSGYLGVEPGWFQAVDYHGMHSANGSNWANGNGGGGAGSGKAGDSCGFGAGGGGVIGFGSAAYIMVGAANPEYRLSYGYMSRNGGAGAGIHGIGGIGEAGGLVTGGTNGYSDRGSYYNFDADNNSGGYGGGGGVGASCALSGLPGGNNAGDGGGLIKLIINGNFTVSKSVISASGTGGQLGGGAGGGGMINIKVAKSIDISTRSSIVALGGESYDTITGASNDVYHSGNGGGGLIKIRATSFNSTIDQAGDTSAWPVSPDACSIKGQLNSNNSLKIYGGSYAEGGLIDLGYYDGTSYCGAGATSNSNIQISKQVQQWNGVGNPSTRDNIKDDNSWSDVLTVTTGKYIRVKINLVNLSSSAMSGVSVSDKLPIDTMALVNFSPPNNILILNKDKSFNAEVVNSGSGASISVPGLTIPANGALIVEYASAIK